jgi:hypothetical protein
MSFFVGWRGNTAGLSLDDSVTFQVSGQARIPGWLLIAARPTTTPRALCLRLPAPHVMIIRDVTILVLRKSRANARIASGTPYSRHPAFSGPLNGEPPASSRVSWRSGFFS